MEEELLQKCKGTVYAADAIHQLLKGAPPGCEPGEAPDLEEELQYAGELMLVQFLSLIRTTLTKE